MINYFEQRVGHELNLISSTDLERGGDVFHQTL